MKKCATAIIKGWKRNRKSNGHRKMRDSLLIMYKCMGKNGNIFLEV